MRINFRHVVIAKLIVRNELNYNAAISFQTPHGAHKIRAFNLVRVT